LKEELSSVALDTTTSFLQEFGHVGATEMMGTVLDHVAFVLNAEAKYAHTAFPVEFDADFKLSFILDSLFPTRVILDVLPVKFQGDILLPIFVHVR
jgi:hypothetical protein